VGREDDTSVEKGAGNRNGNDVRARDGTEKKPRKEAERRDQSGKVLKKNNATSGQDVK
jgi:hypothetical protein